MNGVRSLEYSYAVKLTISEAVKGFPNDKEYAIECQTLIS